MQYNIILGSKINSIIIIIESTILIPGSYKLMCSSVQYLIVIITRHLHCIIQYCECGALGTLYNTIL